MEMDEPKRKNERTDSELPATVVSNTESDAARRVEPKTVKPEPKRAKLNIERELPTIAASTTES